MFKNLYQIVNENIGADILLNSNMLVEYRESMVNEACGSIIDVLKSQIDKGRYDELVAVFKVNHLKDNELVKKMVSQYALKLSKYNGVDMNSAKELSKSVIANIMRDFVLGFKEDGTKGEKEMLAFFNKLSGYTVDFEVLFDKIPQINN